MSLLPRLSDDDLGTASQPDAGFGCLSTERGALPLCELRVAARIAGLAARVDVHQTFVNTLDEAIEATYVFPLPDRAAVTAFRLEVAGRVVEGVIEERARAREQYEQALADGHQAAIAEEERAGVFSVRVGNLPRGERARVHLTLVGALACDDGEATFRFPLVVAPRYVPGTPLPGGDVGLGVASDTDLAPDASRITPPVLLPGFASPVRLALEVELEPGGLDVGDLRASLHTLVVAEDPGEVRRLALQVGERLDRDFVLRFRVGRAGVQSALEVAPDAAGDEASFALTLVPPLDLSVSARARDVAFVLDRSGSMAGWKMVAARRALARMVDTLGSRDRFCVLAFDGEVEEPPGNEPAGLVPASARQRFRAVEFLARIEARGGTELATPLERAAERLAGRVAGRERILVLVTDGQVADEDHILRRLSRSLAGVRVFALGIDQAVNAGFLTRLAALGGGAAELVESEERLDAVMQRVHRLAECGPDRLETLLEELGVLIVELEHDGADERTLAPLRELAETLRAGGDAERLWERAVEVLGAFAKGEPRRRWRAFWK